MTIQSSGAISMGDIRSEYHLEGNSIDIDRLADIAGVANNIGAFYGKSYLNRFGDDTTSININSAGEMTNAAGSNFATVRICIGINGSASASPSAGWIWSKCNGTRGGCIYIYNNNIEIMTARNDYAACTVRFAIPSTWTNDVIREIVWGYNRRINQYIRVDGVYEVNMLSDSYAYLNDQAFSGTYGFHHFLELPSASEPDNIAFDVPSGAQVAPSNIVAKRCDVWRTSYYA